LPSVVVISTSSGSDLPSFHAGVHVRFANVSSSFCAPAHKNSSLAAASRFASADLFAMPSAMISPRTSAFCCSQSA